ncbi:MAG: glycine cleavage system aminomethyltransferase GcvT [Methylobacter sp.]
MLKQTPLYPLHLELGAKMVPYAGYSMPLHYAKGTLHEHVHCRSQAGFFDISHMGLCLVLGDDAAHGLEQLTPCDVSGLKPGEQRYTVLTNSDGGIIDDIIIIRLDSGLLVVINAACKDKDKDYLYRHLSTRCCVNLLTGLSLFALQGPAAAQVMERFSTQAAKLYFMQACGTYINGIKCNVSRSGYTGEDGFEIMVANQDAEELARVLLGEEEVEPIGLAARDTLRLEAGLCLYGHELSESITPIEAGLQWLFKKSHNPALKLAQNKFPGAAKILAQLQQGSDIIRTGLLVNGKIPVREDAELYDGNDAVAGHVTSGNFSPSLGQPVAMALLNRNAANIGNTLYAKVRAHRIEMTVTHLPFVPHRYFR